MSMMGPPVAPPVGGAIKMNVFMNIEIIFYDAAFYTAIYSITTYWGTLHMSLIHIYIQNIHLRIFFGYTFRNSGCPWGSLGVRITAWAVFSTTHWNMCAYTCIYTKPCWRLQIWGKFRSIWEVITHLLCPYLQLITFLTLKLPVLWSKALSSNHEIKSILTVRLVEMI